MLINNFQDVKNSRFLYNLAEKANNFGLQCFFTEIQDPGLEGVYFLCGTNIIPYLTFDKKLGEYIKECRINDKFFVNMRAFKLNGYDDFVTHQHIMIYMHNVELLNRLYKEKGIPLPKKMPNDCVINIRTLYANMLNSKSAWERRCLNTQLESVMSSSASFEEKRTENTFVYDIGKSRFANFWRKHFKKTSSEVSLNYLTTTSARVETIIIKAKYRREIIKALNKNPSIFYHISKVMGEVIKPAYGVGFGPNKEDNDLRHFVLSYKSIQKQEVMDIVDRVLYPDFCKTDIDTLSKEYGDLIGFYFPTYEWENVLNLLEANNVPFAYKTNEYDAFQISLAVPKSHQRMLIAILDRLAKEKADFRICPKNAFGTFKF